MSGHSKWSNIKHKKVASDAKKSKVYSKLIKEITVAARIGGGDPAANSQLRTLLEKARSVNMPRENAVRAIKRGTGDLPGVHYEAQKYEGYGPGGIAVIVDVLTDNKNRAIADLRNLFSRKGGSVAENGAVSWMFERYYVIRGNSKTLGEEELFEALLDYEIKEIDKSEDVWIITCEMQAMEAVKKALKTLDFSVESAELEWVAKELIEIPKDKEKQALDFLESLEDLDDVQNVYTNLA